MALTSSKKNCNYLVAVILKYSENCEIIVPTAKFPILYMPMIVFLLLNLITEYQHWSEKYNRLGF